MIQVEDPLRIAEQSLLDSLSSVPQPLEFSRLTTSSTSSDLFGSVSVSDVITALRERDLKIEEGMGSFAAGEGIEKGRVKKTGTFDCESLRISSHRSKTCAELDRLVWQSLSTSVLSVKAILSKSWLTRSKICA